MQVFLKEAGDKEQKHHCQVCNNQIHKQDSIVVVTNNYKRRYVYRIDKPLYFHKSCFFKARAVYLVQKG